MYGTYRRPEPSNLDLALASLSRCIDGSEIDAWGLAREQQMEPLSADYALQQVVKEGKAYKDGNWYGPSDSFKAEIKAKLAENERIEAENRAKYFSK